MAPWPNILRSRAVDFGGFVGNDGSSPNGGALLQTQLVRVGIGAVH